MLIIRYLLLLTIALGATRLDAANDSPLILRSTGASEVMTIINPSLGTIQIYRIDGETLKQESAYNFSLRLGHADACTS